MKLRKNTRKRLHRQVRAFLEAMDIARTPVIEIPTPQMVERILAYDSKR